jgi:16S rRNA (adenine1518-N6/adenine1519-N6)-dimethyltransferase
VPERRAPPVRKSLGQHFLSDTRILERIVDALQPTQADTVVEIGPGRGALTEILRARAGRVVAIEYDRALTAILREQYARSNVAIVEADVLSLDLHKTAGGPFLLAGNVPYYITTPILFQALQRPRAERAVFLVQKEVAERMSAKPGGKTYGALSVNLQALASAEIVMKVPPGAFRPPPKVDSAVVRVIPRADPVVMADEEASFSAFVQAMFGMRRKQMQRALRAVRNLEADVAMQTLEKLGIDPTLRPESLTPEQFAAVFRATR